MCAHADRVAIEAAVAHAANVAEVAARFGVTKAALTKHALHPRADAPSGEDAATVSSPARPPTRAQRRAPTPSEDEPSPDTVRSGGRTNLSARARAIAIAETIDKLLRQATGEVSIDDEGEIVVGASYAEKASLVRASIAANRQLAQLTGEIGISEAAILSSPIVQRLLTKILDALKAHPEAAKAVLAVLERRDIRSEAA